MLAFISFLAAIVWYLIFEFVCSLPKFKGRSRLTMMFLNLGSGGLLILATYLLNYSKG